MPAMTIDSDDAREHHVLADRLAAIRRGRAAGARGPRVSGPDRRRERLPGFVMAPGTALVRDAVRPASWNIFISMPAAAIGRRATSTPAVTRYSLMRLPAARRRAGVAPVRRRAAPGRTSMRRHVVGPAGVVRRLHQARRRPRPASRAAAPARPRCHRRPAGRTARRCRAGAHRPARAPRGSRRRPAPDPTRAPASSMWRMACVRTNSGSAPAFSIDAAHESSSDSCSSAPPRHGTAGCRRRWRSRHRRRRASGRRRWSTPSRPAPAFCVAWCRICWLASCTALLSWLASNASVGVEAERPRDAAVARRRPHELAESVSMASRDATSPALWPPMPSATANRPAVGVHQQGSPRSTPGRARDRSGRPPDVSWHDSRALLVKLRRQSAMPNSHYPLQQPCRATPAGASAGLTTSAWSN